MGRGAVIELDATTEDDYWVYANNKLIARGEVMVLGENLGVSITENVSNLKIDWRPLPTEPCAQASMCVGLLSRAIRKTRAGPHMRRPKAARSE